MTGLLTLKKADVALPAEVAPMLAEFGAMADSLPLTLARESLERHIVSAAGNDKGALKAVRGNDKEANEMLDLGTKLMSIHWPSLTNFQECVARARRRGPP